MYMWKGIRYRLGSYCQETIYIKPRRLDFSRSTVDCQQKSVTVISGFPEHSASNAGPLLAWVRSHARCEDKASHKGSYLFLFLFLSQIELSVVKDDKVDIATFSCLPRKTVAHN